ncbi:MAG TPA: type 4a pilus biogenesis protein PilO [Armatimonadota bacterium]|nr:type 4a pilus biogenesis protein PilO [Armatimonadota bacterium]
MQLKQSRFTLMLLAIATVGILVLIIGFIILHHQDATTTKLHDEYAQKKNEFDENQEKIRNLDQDKLKLVAIEEHLAVLDKNLADYKYMPTYLQQIQNTAVRTGNTIKSIQPGDTKSLDLQNSPFASATKGSPTATPASTPPAPQGQTDAKTSTAGKYQVQGINLEIQGSYISFVRLLNAFRQFPKMIYVKSIDLTPQGDQHSGTNLSARLQTYAIITPDQYEAETVPTDTTGGTTNEKQ